MKELLLTQIEHRRADLAMVQGEQKLLAGQYAQARERFASANDFFHQRKLRLTLIGLRVAPQLLRRLYDLREQSFARKYKLKSIA